MPKVIKICKTCQKRFERYVSPSRGKHTVSFCSHKCKGISYHGREVSQEQKLKISKALIQKGFSINIDGYKDIRKFGVKRYYEHRKVMSDFIGRELKSSEIIHHINGNKLDNRPENLTVMTRSEHINHHRKELTAGRCLGI